MVSNGNRSSSIFAAFLKFAFSNVKDKIHRTIEDELVDAFVKVGAVPQAHADDMSKVCDVSPNSFEVTPHPFDFQMAFQRAARTDKGVSAVANLISLKLIPFENLTDMVNEHLPKQIRMFGKFSSTHLNEELQSTVLLFRCETCRREFQ